MRAQLLTGFAAAGLIALAAAPSAMATVTIGQTAGASLVSPCSPDDQAQGPVTTGTQYEVPSTGGIVNWTLTTWSHQARVASDQQIKIKVYRRVSGLTYTVVGQDGPRILASGVLNTFTASIPVKPGDILGITPTSNVGCTFGSFVGEAYYHGDGDAATGAQVTFTPDTGTRLNISATLEPTNTITFGKTRRNKKKGTATVTVNVPNPGELTASGKGVKAAGVTSKAVSGPGSAKLVLKAKGKKKRKLNDTGKVKLNATISYTPTGGAASTQSRKVKLKKNL
jgi:hypothetical protein